MSFALSILKQRAIIKKPADHNLGIVPEYAVDASDVPCWIVPETERRTDTGLGRMVTGRWQILFQAGTDVKPGYQVLVTEPVVGKYSTEWRDVGTFDIDTAISTTTHVETIAIKQT